MLLNDSVKKELAKHFTGLEGNVKLVVFTQTIECRFCEETRMLAEEIAEQSDKVTAEVFNFAIDKEKVEEYNIEMIPAIAVVGEKDYGIRLYGIPAGYELTSLLEAIKTVSTGTTMLSEDSVAYLKGLEEDVNLQVFVTPT